jgi:hypothetical protein
LHFRHLHKFQSVDRHRCYSSTFSHNQSIPEKRMLGHLHLRAGVDEQQQIWDFTSEHHLPCDKVTVLRGNFAGFGPPCTFNKALKRMPFAKCKFANVTEVTVPE